MATSHAPRFLQGQHASDDQNLALKMFSGFVIEAFKATTLLWNSVDGGQGVGGAAAPVVASKSVEEGKSWQWPIIGDDPTPEYHTPGTELLGQDIQTDEGTITIDQILVAHQDVPIDQQIMSHWDVLQPFARRLGRSLAVDFDAKLFITGVRSARTAAVTNIHSGGQRVTRGGSGATVATMYPISTDGAQNFINDANQLARLLDDQNVPEEGRFLFITPYIREVLQQNTNIMNRDFSALTNDLNKRVIAIVAGFAVAVTNQLPSTNITTGLAKYQGNYTTGTGVAAVEVPPVGGPDVGAAEPVALALAGASEGSAAIGYVSARGIQAFMGPDERRNTTFMKAQMIVGAGVLSPWCAGEIGVDNTA